MNCQLNGNPLFQFPPRTTTVYKRTAALHVFHSKGTRIAPSKMKIFSGFLTASALAADTDCNKLQALLSISK